MTNFAGMEKEESQRIANEFAKGLKGFVNEALYVGIIDGEPVYYIERVHHGGHLGLPPYFSVSEEGEVNQLIPPKVFRAAKMRHNLVSNL